MNNFLLFVACLAMIIANSGATNLRGSVKVPSVSREENAFGTDRELDASCTVSCGHGACNPDGASRTCDEGYTTVLDDTNSEQCTIIQKKWRTAFILQCLPIIGWVGAADFYIGNTLYGLAKLMTAFASLVLFCGGCIIGTVLSCFIPDLNYRVTTLREHFAARYKCFATANTTELVIVATHGLDGHLSKVPERPLSDASTSPAKSNTSAVVSISCCFDCTNVCAFFAVIIWWFVDIGIMYYTRTAYDGKHLTM